MPLNLTTPYDPGENDTQDYTHFRVDRLAHKASRKRIEVMGTFGTMGDSGFVPGEGALARNFSWGGADYLAMVSEPPVGSETAYQAVRRIVYEKIQADDPRFAGTIE